MCFFRLLFVLEDYFGASKKESFVFACSPPALDVAMAESYGFSPATLGFGCGDVRLRRSNRPA